MSRSYPIWHDVTACNYVGDKSYGSKNNAHVTVKIGSCASNSHGFVSHETTREVYGFGEARRVRFQFWACGALIKETIFKAGRNDRPEKLISEKCAYVGRVIHQRVKQSRVY